MLQRMAVLFFVVVFLQWKIWNADFNFSPNLECLNVHRNEREKETYFAKIIKTKIKM
jgi:hypothetical protein